MRKVNVDVQPSTEHPGLLVLTVSRGTLFPFEFMPILQYCATEGYEAVGKQMHICNPKPYAVLLHVADDMEQLWASIVATLCWQLGRSGHTTYLLPTSGLLLIGAKGWLQTGVPTPVDEKGDSTHFFTMLHQKEQWFPKSDRVSPMCNILESLPHVATFSFTAGALRAELPAYLKYGSGKLCIGATDWRAIGVFE